jgi:protein MpaA
MNNQPLMAACLAFLTLIGTAAGDEVTLGHSVEGRPLLARVHGPQDAPETLLIVASIHGTEPAGTPLVECLEAWMADHPNEWRDKRIVVIPVANPDGYAKRERFNVHGVDLNRNFPADNRTEHTTHGEAPLSEPESRALMRALRTYNPSRVVSLHQPIDCIDYDGPGEALAKAMSKAIDGRLPVKKLGGRPGSMGSYVGETLGKPIITVEFPKHAEKRSTDELWDDYGPALVAFVRGVPSNQQP